VTAGYGGYGEASSLTWNTHGRVVVRPVMECQGVEGTTICPFYLVAPSSWYVPERRDTFLLVDSEEPWLSSLPSGLGKPVASYAFGEMRMYIYPYDIASRFAGVILDRRVRNAITSSACPGFRSRTCVNGLHWTVCGRGGADPESIGQRSRLRISMATRLWYIIASKRAMSLPGGLDASATFRRENLSQWVAHTRSADRGACRRL
jgi:hypothetical protein